MVFDQGGPHRQPPTQTAKFPIGTRLLQFLSSNCGERTINSRLVISNTMDDIADAVEVFFSKGGSARQAKAFFEYPF
jgi:hypothetical protein